MRLTVTVFAIICSLYSLSAQNNFTISGYIRDAANGESLLGSTVYINETGNGAAANPYGFYSITLPSGDYTVQYRYIGYLTIEKQIALNENMRIDIELSTELQKLEEVVVTGEREDANVTSIEMSVNKLDIKTLQKLPAFLGEVDVLRSIQLLPGVSTVGEGASGFNVRGGGVGQNLILLDEAPVYNSSHLLGFFSVFNPDAVKDVKLYKGGIPARYGGRISSILDIRMKEGNSKQLNAQGGIGTIFSRLAIEAPIIKDKASFIIAGRRSYGDVLAKAFTDVLDDGAALNFYDLTAKANYNIDSKNRVFLSGYFGRDNFKFDAEQGFSWGNATGTLRWNHLFNDRLFANFTTFFSDYDYELSFGEDQQDRFDWDSRIRTYGFKPEFSYYLNPNNEITFGAEALYYRFNPANAVGISSGESIDISVPDKFALESAVFISNNQKVSDKLELQYGIRFSQFNYLGKGPYYTYEQSRIIGQQKTLLKTDFAKSGETIAQYGNLEPRFSAKYELNSSSSLKLSYNRTAQYIHLISNTTASNPLDVWTPSTNNIKPQLGDQIALGYFRNLGPDNDYEISGEIYYKDIKNQIDYIPGADILINQRLEGELLGFETERLDIDGYAENGVGRAYGLELYAKKNKGQLTGWMSYTLSRSEQKVTGVNNDDWYPNRFDQLHNLTVAAFYELNKRWTLSSNFTYTSGTPTTFPTSRFTQQDLVIPFNYQNSRNGIRIPSYHRLDIAATLYGKKVKGNGKVRKNENYWVFSVYNLYSRRNPFSIYFSQGGDRIPVGDQVPTVAKRVSIIGSFFPSVSYNFKF